jgi:hypothetical protein
LLIYTHYLCKRFQQQHPSKEQFGHVSEELLFLQSSG